MRKYREIYTQLLSITKIGNALGEHPIGGTYIEFPGNGFNRICLYEHEKTLQGSFSLIIFAGDTCKQARDLYKHFTYSKAIKLESQGWTLQSHFHLAWQRKNILFTKGDKDLPLREYIDYWKSALGEGIIRKYNKVEFDLLLKKMQDAKVMNNRDVADFNEYFRTHNYQSSITCPGIINWISYSKERLKGNLETLSVELHDKLLSLIEIYN